MVDDSVSERGDPLVEAGDAERRGPHVHAAPPAAEVERHADDVYAALHDGRAACGQRREAGGTIPFSRR